MITEDYVSFETAKLLKGKGFDAKCQKYYSLKRLTTLYYGYEYVKNRNLKDEDACLAPTLQMVMKWLREEYKIFICIVSLEDIGMYGFGIEDISSKKYLATSKSDRYPTYEQAAEAAIKYCLENLI